METTASFEARSAPSLYSTFPVGWDGIGRRFDFGLLFFPFFFCFLLLPVRAPFSFNVDFDEADDGRRGHLRRDVQILFLGRDFLS